MSVPHDNCAPDGAIHSFFGLTYANYLVVPRTVLQSMPLEWQERFVALVGEIDEAFPDLPASGYDVRVLARCAERLDSEDCPTCEGEGVVEGDGPDPVRCPEECDDGQIEADRWETPEEVGIISDPIPGYNRGRTRLLPVGARP